MMEERLPLLFVLPPAWFLSKYPSIHSNMNINTERILTPFDVHKTLLHLIKLNEHGTYIDSNMSEDIRGFSFFEEIPFNRSCESAEIPFHYCPCNLIGGGLADSKSKKFEIGAQLIVAKVNDLLKPFHDKCVTLKLNHIAVVRIFSINGQDYNPNYTIDFHNNSYNSIRSSNFRLLLTVEVEPSEALFEASLKFNSITQSYDKIVGDVSRINKYGNQSSCIIDQAMKKFCYCKSNLTNDTVL
ncbi:unnamed protein product [Gordionus sp. m RMFG-2023]